MLRTLRLGAIRAGLAGVPLALVLGLSLGSVPGSRTVGAQSVPPPAPVAALNLEVIGHHDLGQTANRTSDVWILDRTAVVGYRCNAAKGSSVVDISDPTRPKVTFQADVLANLFTDDVFLLRVDTAAFKGDVFVEPFDQCANETGAVTRFWDVTDRANPTLLSTLFHGDGAHNSFAFQRGANAYVVLAMPGGDTADNTQYGYEDRDLDADFAIVDITDPRAPAVVSAWNAHSEWTDLPPSTFQHDVWVNKAGTMAYGAYWDAGMLLVDISDVTKPKGISRWGYADIAEGNTHQVVPTKNEDYVVIADEDFDPTAGTFEVTAPPSLAGSYKSSPGSFADMLMGQPPFAGETVWVGRGCDADPDYNLTQPDPYLAEPTGKVAVILRGGCSFAGKVEEAQKHGAVAAIVVNTTPGGGPAPMGGAPRQGTTIPATGIPYDLGHAITTTLEAGTPVSVKFGIGPGEWGYTRFVDVRNPQSPRQVAEYVMPETRQFPPADGNFSVHNAWVDGDVLYLSHYNGGIRMLDISDPTRPRETGHFVPAKRDVAGNLASSSVWGVMTDDRGLVYASDMTYGLWVLCRGIGCAATWVQQQPTPTLPPPTSLPPPQTPTPQPTAVPPLPTPQTGNVCPQIVNRVPAAAINAALANPARVHGYNKPQDFGKPPHPIYNRMRTWLSIRTYAKPYHPLFNSLEYKVGCP